MTMVHFRLADPSGIPLDGYVSLVPTRRVTVGDEIRLPTAVRVQLQDGEATVDMLPSTTQWVWRVAELVKGGITRYVAVPDTDTVVEYAALESVDPSSLDVSSASVPAWEIATRTAQEMLDKVGEIDGKVERAEDAAAGAESSASEAESHENAARSSADAAASSARDAASSAGEASGSAEASAGSARAAALSASDAAAHAESAGSSADAAAVSATAAASSAAAAAGSVATAASHATSAAQSATAASQSASQAQSSATAADSSAQAASTSAETAKMASDSATSSKDAAAQSASEASASASAAKASETNAASSASAAVTSETNAASSATAAQQAVDGFGLTVGSVTTGEPGTDASVDITKDGTKYTADFTIPRGDAGPAGVNENVPTRTVSGLIAHADDAYPVAPREIRIHGGSFSSLNLLGKNFAVVSSYGSRQGNTATVNDDGSITVKAVTADTSDYLFLKNFGKILVPGVEFTISLTDRAGAPITDINGILSVISAGLPADVGRTDAVNHGVVPDDYASDRFQIQIPPNVSFNGTVFMQIEYGDKATSWEKPIVYAAPVNAELARDDTLVISEDGSCRVERASGEPTQLEPIELPVLPAPTFNVYTDSIVPPTVDVTYEQDVNLVIQGLEAKIAALQVAEKTN